MKNNDSITRLEKLENGFKEIVEKIAGSPLGKEIQRQKIIEKINHYKDQMQYYEGRVIWLKGCLKEFDKKMSITKDKASN